MKLTNSRGLSSRIGQNKSTRGRPSCKWEDNNKIGLEKIKRNGVVTQSASSGIPCADDNAL